MIAPRAANAANGALSHPACLNTDPLLVLLAVPAKSRGFDTHCCCTALLSATPARIGLRLETSFLSHSPTVARVLRESVLGVIVVSCFAFNHTAPCGVKRVEIVGRYSPKVAR